MAVLKNRQRFDKLQSDTISKEVKEAEKKVLELQKITNQQRQRMKEQYESLLVRDRVRDARKKKNGSKENHRIAMQKAKRRIDNAIRLQQQYMDMMEDLSEKQEEIVNEKKLKILMRDKFKDNGEVISYLLIENGKLKGQNEAVRTTYKGKVDEHLKGVNSKINRLEVLTKSKRGSMGSTFRQYLKNNSEKDQTGSISTKKDNKKKKGAIPEENNDFQFFDSIPREEFKVETIDDKMKKVDEQAAKLKELTKKQTQGYNDDYSRRLEDKISDLKKINDDADQRAKKALEEAKGRIDYYKMMQRQYVNDYEVSENLLMKNRKLKKSLSEEVKCKIKKIKQMREENEEKKKNKDMLRVEYETEVSKNGELDAYNRRASHNIYNSSPDSDLDTIVKFSVLKQTSKGLKEKYEKLSEDLDEWQTVYWSKASEREERQKKINSILTLIETNCEDEKLIKATRKLATECQNKKDTIMSHLQNIYGDDYDDANQADEMM